MYLPLLLLSTLLFWSRASEPSSVMSARLASQHAPRNYLALFSLPTFAWVTDTHHHIWLLHGYWGPNTNLHTCEASTLPTKPSPSLTSIFLLCSVCSFLIPRLNGTLFQEFYIYIHFWKPHLWINFTFVCCMWMCVCVCLQNLAGAGLNLGPLTW